MSSRTAGADKAIRLAWQRGCELIQEGKGTRDWTVEQQRDILNPELGKAYDEDGKAFEGHHMKSVEAFPGYQGNSDNIQFLTRAEHTQAHGGWRKPTNGYYDYITGITYDFDDGFSPCKIIDLSNPVIVIDNCNNIDMVENLDKQAEKELSSGTDPPSKDSQRLAEKTSSDHKDTKSQRGNLALKETAISSIKNVANAVKKFPDKHPVLTTVVGVGLGLAVTTVTGKEIGAKINHSRRTSSSLLNQQALKSATETAADVVSKFDFKNSESALKQLGYTVAKSIGLSDIDRQKTLQKAISNGVMSKEAICAFLENNINLHKNQSTFTEAVGKWIADLAYIRDVL